MFPKKTKTSPHKYCEETSTWVEQSPESKHMHHQSHHNHQRNSLCTVISPVASVKLEITTSSSLATFNSAPSLSSTFLKKLPEENRLNLSNSSVSPTSCSSCSSPLTTCSAFFTQPHTPNNNHDTNRLKILSYNIWFSPYFYRERSLELVSIIEREEVDIVCLQEVTQRALNVFKEHKYIQQNFVLSALDSNSWSEYGLIIMTRINSIEDLSFYSLPTSQDRNLLVLDLTINNEKFVVATVHLESLNTISTRKRQLSIISQILTTYRANATVLLAGDFNFDSEQNYNDNAAPLENDVLVEHFSEYSDVWASLNYLNGLPPPPPLSDGKTYDTRLNLMLHNQKFERMRYDRIMMKEPLGEVKHKKWVAVDCSLVGIDPFLTDTEMGCLVYPSDHFGLLVELEYREMNFSLDD